IFNRRWSAAFKELLYASRVRSTANIVAALAKTPTGKCLVNASAVGYYGPTGAEELTETSPAGTDFLARLCVDWEKATAPAAAQGIRTVVLRTGVVLDPHGGALQKMMTPFKMFVGGPIGSGKQFVSWIHHQDMVGLILCALDNDLAAGPLNAAAPGAVTNKVFSTALGRALHRPSLMPTPGFMLRVALGPVAGVITTGQRVVPKKALDLGYKFKFAEIDAALQDIVSN
ncbi:MAG TPA: TIGR01777 family oxidoreductase, partial [Gemmataceae bacterium]|nr:TIGR01777 family oxidoreductase [Gemmataceae bacterium]